MYFPAFETAELCTNLLQMYFPAFETAELLTNYFLISKERSLTHFFPNGSLDSPCLGPKETVESVLTC